MQHHLAQDAREAACLGIGNEDEVVQIRATRVVVVWTVPVIPLKQQASSDSATAQDSSQEEMLLGQVTRTFTSHIFPSLSTRVMVPEQAENQSCNGNIVTVIHSHEPR